MPEVEVVQATNEQIGNIVKDAVSAEFAQEKDRQKKEDHINKVLKKDTVVDKRNKVDNKNKLHTHDDFCPGCSSAIEDLGSGVHKCTGPDCGQMSLDKGAEFVICADCGGIVPKSYVGTDKGCPNCGGSKVKP